MADNIQPLKTKGVPVEYLSLNDVWNDRRDPHANPTSSAPRRQEARCHPGELSGLVEQIYRGQPTHRAGDE